MMGTKAFGLVIASLLSFQSSVGFCVCHPDESHPPLKVVSSSHTDSPTDGHPCHSHSAEGEPSHSGSSLKTEANTSTHGHDHDKKEGCCCIRKDDTAVQSETYSLGLEKVKFSTVALEADQTGAFFGDSLFLGKYCQSHAPPHKTPLYLRLKTLRI